MTEYYILCRKRRHCCVCGAQAHIVALSASRYACALKYVTGTVPRAQSIHSMRTQCHIPYPLQSKFWIHLCVSVCVCALTYIQIVYIFFRWHFKTTQLFSIVICVHTLTNANDFLERRSHTKCNLYCVYLLCVRASYSRLHLVFILCWSPYIVFDLLQVFGRIPRTQSNIAIATFIQSLAPLNSAANPLIYCLFSAQVCRVVRYVLFSLLLFLLLLFIS